MSRLGALSPRERVLVLLVLPVALIAAGWIFAWQPLQAARAGHEARIAEARLIAAAATSGDVPAAPAAPADARPLAARVTEAAEAMGVPLSRLEPEGEALRITVAEMPFAALVLWLADMEDTRGLALTAVEIDRRTAPGAVTARILLEDAL